LAQASTVFCANQVPPPNDRWSRSQSWPAAHSSQTTLHYSVFSRAYEGPSYSPVCRPAKQDVIPNAENSETVLPQRSQRVHEGLRPQGYILARTREQRPLRMPPWRSVQTQQGRMRVHVAGSALHDAISWWERSPQDMEVPSLLFPKRPEATLHRRFDMCSDYLSVPPRQDTQFVRAGDRKRS
jgi:hypothetical protein